MDEAAAPISSATTTQSYGVRYESVGSRHVLSIDLVASSHQKNVLFVIFLSPNKTCALLVDFTYHGGGYIAFALRERLRLTRLQGGGLHPLPLRLPTRRL